MELNMPTTAEISTTDPTRIVVDTPFVMKEHVKAVPGAKWDSEAREWTVPLSWPACIALTEEYPDLDIGPYLREWGMKLGPVKKWLRKSRLNIKPNEGDTAINSMIDDHSEFDFLRPHQKMDALCAYMAGGSYLLMNEVGTGKTYASLAAVRLLDIAQERGGTDPFPVLIVCPKSMVRTWEREIRKAFPEAWGEESRTISLVDGTPATVRKALEPGFDFYIIGWELLRKYSRIAAYGSTAIPKGANVDKELNELGISTIIGDEIHRVSNPTSQRSRAFKYLCHNGANYRLGLTGTPMQEGAIDLWHILHCIVPNDYATKTSYISRYLIEEWGDWGERIIKGVRPDRDEEFRRNFESVTRRMTTDIIPNLPEVIDSVRWVDLPPKHRKAYESMRKNLIAEVEGGTLTAQNQLVKAGRLVQLANSYGELEFEDAIDPETGETFQKERFLMTDKSPKLDALMEDISNGDFDGHSVVIFSDSKQLLKFLAERFDKAKPPVSYCEITGDVTGEDRQTAMDEFQAGEKQFCLLTRAGGEGITLTAADIMVRLVAPWSYRTAVQVDGRIRRIGSEKFEHIQRINYLVQDTIDEEIVIRLNQKGEAAEEVLQDGELLAMLKSDED